MGLFAVVDKMTKLQDENEWLKSALIGSQNEVERLTAKLAETNGELEQAYTLLEYRAESGRIREAAKALDPVMLSKSLYEGWSK